MYPIFIFIIQGNLCSPFKIYFPFSLRFASKHMIQELKISLGVTGPNSTVTIAIKFYIRRFINRQSICVSIRSVCIGPNTMSLLYICCQMV